MESFRLVCRDGRGEWYMHDAEAANALAAFEHTVAAGRSPHVVVPERLGRGVENSIIQRWKLGGTDLGDCLNCGYELKGLIRAADGLAICPECGVGSVMKPRPADPIPPSTMAAPGFVPGSVLDGWGFAFSLLGVFSFPLAMVGIVMGAFAYEFSRGAKGHWAMRAGAAVLAIHAALFVAKLAGISF